jgi:hypothetical protein
MQITWVDPDREQEEVMVGLASRFSGPLLQNNCRAVAIMPFLGMNKQVSSLGRALAINLQSALVRLRTRSNILERDWDLLIKAINEMELSESGLIDKSTAARTGRMIGADTLIFGWVYDTGNSFKVTIQALNVERGKIVATADGFLSRTSNRLSQSNQYFWK